MLLVVILSSTVSPPTRSSPRPRRGAVWARRRAHRWPWDLRPAHLLGWRRKIRDEETVNPRNHRKTTKKTKTQKKHQEPPKAPPIESHNPAWWKPRPYEWLRCSSKNHHKPPSYWWDYHPQLSSVFPMVWSRIVSFMNPTKFAGWLNQSQKCWRQQLTCWNLCKKSTQQLSKPVGI